MGYLSSFPSEVNQLVLINNIYIEFGLLKGNIQSCLDVVMFKSIASVMTHGAKKQLDFEDLLQLPTDMDPTSCHDQLLSCWQSQHTDNCSSPSLFRAICGAYGWPYFRLGLLKVIKIKNKNTLLPLMMKIVFIKIIILSI